MGTKFIKLLGLIAGVAAANVALLSPGLLGMRIGGGAFETAVGVTGLLASAIVLLYGGYSIGLKPETAIPVKQIRSHEDYVEALSRYKRAKSLEKEMAVALGQLERMRKKQLTLSDVLDQRFDPAELSYGKFASVAREVEKLFYANARSMLNRLRVFDESELDPADPARFSKELLQEKTNLHNENVEFVRHSVAANEEILLKLDRLLLEISRLDSFEPGDIENMPGMLEIDSLIKQTKYYKS
ncbi:hypothetical protein ACFPPD_20750 [Cohnella suwonensis]|uniref:5-bromo-4-chloroindolyl phosphate hydrolysis protein n=1 Tax=Cohnella suwonensis TaxID=696072 RepID=A0ABW0M1H0_9BACL